ncbi:MAG: efflux RND transporter periplasmic adaptor subunit [candidate division WOR-3 bacterium]
MRRIPAMTLLILSLISIWGCRGQKHGGTRAEAPLAVRVEPVRTANVVRTVHLLATLQGENQTMVFSKIAGRVTAIVKPEGTTVAAGEPIAYVLNDIPGMDYQPGPVLSPITGTVGRVYVEPGQSVSPSTPLAVVASFSSRIKARALVSEADLPYIRRGARVELEFSAIPDTVFSGTVTSVPPMLDPLTRSAAIEIAVANPGRRLVPGMSAGVRVLAEERQNAIAVPLTALFTDGTYRVTVVEGNIARFRTVQIGLLGDELVEITSGLQPGERVVTLGKEHIRDGQAVNPVETQNR